MSIRIFGKVSEELELTEPVKGWESRGSSTMSLVFDADSRGWLCRPLDAMVYIADVFNADASFSTAGSAADKDRIVPPYSFYDWPEVHIFGYEAMIRKIVSASKISPIYPKLFWAGFETNQFRKVAAEWAKNVANVEFRLMADWDRTDPAHLQHSMRVSLPSHTKYAALVDLPAAGFSARLPFLLASGRPLIIVERPQEQWFYWDVDGEGISPWVHYVPSAATTDGLAAAWMWIQDHPADAHAMAARAQHYVLYNLSTEVVLCRFATRLCPNSTCVNDIAAAALARAEVRSVRSGRTPADSGDSANAVSSTSIVFQGGVLCSNGVYVLFSVLFITCAITFFLLKRR